jgi:hypothetical protein
LKKLNHLSITITSSTTKTSLRNTQNHRKAENGRLNILFKIVSLFKDFLRKQTEGNERLKKKVHTLLSEDGLLLIEMFIVGNEETHEIELGLIERDD